MSSSCGRTARSSGGLNGIGVSGAVSRRTGASRCSKQRSADERRDLRSDARPSASPRGRQHLAGLADAALDRLGVERDEACAGRSPRSTRRAPRPPARRARRPSRRRSRSSPRPRGRSAPRRAGRRARPREPRRGRSGTCPCARGSRPGWDRGSRSSAGPWRRPAVAGATTFRPGACRNHASGFCEWNGPPEKPPPDGSRITIGTARPWRKCIFAATLTSWSKPQEMKSANCISQTGFSPSIAAPTAAPMIAFSASGVSITRSAPNSSTKPSVTLKAPPNAPTSSPKTEHRLVAAHLLAQRVGDRLQVGHLTGLDAAVAGRGAAAGVEGSSWVGGAHAATSSIGRSGTMAPCRRPAAATRSRRRRPLGLAGSGIGEASAASARRRDLRRHLGSDRLDPLGVEAVLGDEPLAVAVDRVAIAPLGEHLLRHVAHVVVGAVAVHAHRPALDQRRAAARAGPLGGVGGGGEDRLDVVAVDGDAGEAVARGPLDRVDRELERRSASSTRTRCSRA